MQKIAEPKKLIEGLYATHPGTSSTPTIGVWKSKWVKELAAMPPRSSYTSGEYEESVVHKWWSTQVSVLTLVLKQRQTSPKVRNRGTSGATKRKEKKKMYYGFLFHST